MQNLLSVKCETATLFSIKRDQYLTSFPEFSPTRPYGGEKTWERGWSIYEIEDIRAWAPLEVVVNNIACSGVSVECLSVTGDVIAITINVIAWYGFTLSE